ncbi:hypothetical protein PHMEG_00027791 [Phytophthora megakarya]|uniref:Uncharacterized protein n=1 Tax=Phytophthora megakarya TaxID=4795 RepID=A0A225V7P5_9STRA|nr:hypothetical protein PHMEG_00027791 [Phytophthora megakarya]
MLRQLPRPPSPSQEFASPEAPLSNNLSGADALNPVLYSSPPEDSQAVHIQLGQDTELEQSTQREDDNDASGEEDADEPDDSDDEDWSDSEDVEADGVVTGESAGSEAEEVGISINLFDIDLQQQVACLISADKCKRRCLEGKAKELEWLTYTTSRRRGTGEREKFHFYLPFVGHVCRTAFAHCLGVRPLTVQRYKRRVREGNIAIKEHGNKLNKNASTIDAVWLVRWFKEFASDGRLTEPEKVTRMFTHFLEDLSPPPRNTEKMLELHSKIGPYVPEEHQGNWVYAAPSEQQKVDAKTAKQARREHRAAMAASAKANQDRRGRETDFDARPTPKKSRK